MARAIVVSERQADSTWKPTVVFLATRARLDARALPGDARRSAWVASELTTARRGATGDWEAWIDEGLRINANGHDLWATEVEPEVTLELLFQREVLGVEPQSITPPELQPSDTLPELGGFSRVTPR